MFVPFIISLILMGLFLITAYGFISSTNSSASAGSTLSRAILGIYTIGILFMTIGIMMFFCANSCSSYADNSFINMKFYLYFIAMLGITLIVLSSIILATGDNSDTTTSGFLISTLVIGIVMFLITSFIIYNQTESAGKASSWFSNLFNRKATTSSTGISAAVSGNTGVVTQTVGVTPDGQRKELYEECKKINLVTMKEESESDLISKYVAMTSKYNSIKEALRIGKEQDHLLKEQIHNYGRQKQPELMTKAMTAQLANKKVMDDDKKFLNELASQAKIVASNGGFGNNLKPIEESSSHQNQMNPPYKRTILRRT